MNSAVDERRGTIIDRETAFTVAECRCLWGYRDDDYDIDTDLSYDDFLQHYKIYDPTNDIPQIQTIHMPPAVGADWHLTTYDAIDALASLDSLAITDDDLVRVVALTLVSINTSDPEAFDAYANVVAAARDEQRRRNEAKRVKPP